MATESSGQTLPEEESLLIRHFTGSTLFSALSNDSSTCTNPSSKNGVQVVSICNKRPKQPPPPPPRLDSCFTSNVSLDCIEKPEFEKTSVLSDSFVLPTRLEANHSCVHTREEGESKFSTTQSADDSPVYDELPESVYSVSLHSPSRPNSACTLARNDLLHISSDASDSSGSLCYGLTNGTYNSERNSNQIEGPTIAKKEHLTNLSPLHNLSLTQPEKCVCSCHCKNSRRSPGATKTGKLLSSLAKLTLNGIRSGLDVRLPNKTNQKSPSCSLSSFGSPSPSVSGGSSVQENQYNLGSTFLNIKRPNRPPPLPPPNKPRFRMPAMLPEPEYEDSFGIRRSVEKLLRERFAEYADVSDLLYEQLDCEKKNEEGDYDSVKEDDEENSEDENFDEEEDLYQDVLFEDDSNDISHTERIYETLSSVRNAVFSARNCGDENVYSNKSSIDELDRKLMRKQKLLDKKRQAMAEKLKKRFSVTGNEIPVNAGIVKTDQRGNQFDLRVNKSEIVLILRIDGNPPGKWLAKNERGKIGYVDLNLINVDPESIKALMNVRNVLTEAD